jgi:hypothetical protein
MEKIGAELEEIGTRHQEWRFHPQVWRLNEIEMTWEQVKTYIARLDFHVSAFFPTFCTTKTFLKDGSQPLVSSDPGTILSRAMLAKQQLDGR